jgi:hypothetical protein
MPAQDWFTWRGIAGIAYTRAGRQGWGSGCHLLNDLKNPQRPAAVEPCVQLVPSEFGPYLPICMHSIQLQFSSHVFTMPETSKLRYASVSFVMRRRWSMLIFRSIRLGNTISRSKQASYYYWLTMQLINKVFLHSNVSKLGGAASQIW